LSYLTHPLAMGKLVCGGVGWETAVELNEFNQ
jgi:hypothetical protein